MRLHWAIALAAVCIAVVIGVVACGAGNAGDVPEVVRAQRFEVVDQKGVLRAVLGLTKQSGGGVSLALCDENGKARAGISVSDLGGAGITIADERETPRILMTVHAGFTSVQLLSGKARTLSEVLPGGTGSDQEVLDAAEKMGEAVEIRAMLAMDDETDSVNIALFDEKGQPIWQAE